MSIKVRAMIMCDHLLGRQANCVNSIETWCTVSVSNFGTQNIVTDLEPVLPDGWKTLQDVAPAYFFTNHNEYEKAAHEYVCPECVLSMKRDR